MELNMTKTNQLGFKPRARLLQLLGEQLIGSPKLALFELVKNAYDADATEVLVEIKNPLVSDKGNAVITISDDGCGMSLETLENVWLEPGTDNRTQKQRSNKFKRTHLGEKGVGRFAVHKIGDCIELTTKTENGKTYQLKIDWEELLQKKYMDELSVKILEIDDIKELPVSGTIIKLSKLKSSWDKKNIESLYKSVNSIQSPFDIPKDLLGPITGSFKVFVKVPEHTEWFNNWTSVDEILKHCFYKFEFTIENGEIKYDYVFSPPRALQSKGIEGRDLKSVKSAVPFNSDRTKRKRLATEDQVGIGKIHGEFYVFAFDAEINELLTVDVNKMIKPYLRENGGIRVYRDGIRVYNYGEPGDDWLELDSKRVKHFGSGINKALILGAVNLALEDSPQLIEKTNREGFIENDAYDNLKHIVNGAISILSGERHSDKERMRRLIIGDDTPESYDPMNPISKLKRELQELDGSEECLLHLQEAEKYVGMIRETMIESNSRGIHISLVYHEFEKFIDHFLNKFLDKENLTKEELSDCYSEIRRISEMIKSFNSLVKKDSIKKNSLNKTVNKALRLQNSRFNYHEVNLVSQFASDAKDNIECKFTVSSLSGVIINVLDNALYWLQVKWPDKSHKRKIYIGTTDFYGSPALVIADNGPGFKGDPIDLVKPFVTFKPDGVGMGLGLYYAQMVMDMIDGELVLENASNLDFLPDDISGAAVILVFKNL